MSSIVEQDATTEEPESINEIDIKDALCSLRRLLEGDEEEQRETFQFLKCAINEDRPSHRRLFP